MNQAIIKILKEEKEHNDVNYFYMKQALDYKEKYLQNKDGDMFLTVNFLIVVNNLITGHTNRELRKVNVKPAGYSISIYYPWWYVESSLYILIHDFNEKRKTNREFCERFMEIHPFLDGNGRARKLLFINQIVEEEEEYAPCCLMN